MKITDRRAAKAWVDVDEDDVDWLVREPARLLSMTVDANEDAFENSGLLDVSGQPLGRRRRGPGFGIYR